MNLKILIIEYDTYERLGYVPKEQNSICFHIQSENYDDYTTCCIIVITI